MIPPTETNHWVPLYCVSGLRLFTSQSLSTYPYNDMVNRKAALDEHPTCKSQRERERERESGTSLLPFIASLFVLVKAIVSRRRSLQYENWRQQTVQKKENCHTCSGNYVI